MADIRIKICDRCGEEMKTGKFPNAKITKTKIKKILGFGLYDYLESDYDLCSKCSKALDLFMKNEED